jgi:hypothetical protein
VKWLFIMAFVGALFYGASYAGARATAGKMLGGERDNMGTRTVRFLWKGVESLPGKPRGWEFSYSRARVNGNPPVRIYLSPTGRVFATVPRDLDQRLEAAERASEAL